MTPANPVIHTSRTLAHPPCQTAASAFKHRHEQAAEMARLITQAIPAMVLIAEREGVNWADVTDFGELCAKLEEIVHRVYLEGEYHPDAIATECDPHSAWCRKDDLEMTLDVLQQAEADMPVSGWTNGPAKNPAAASHTAVHVETDRTKAKTVRATVSPMDLSAGSSAAGKSTRLTFTPAEARLFAHQLQIQADAAEGGEG